MLAGRNVARRGLAAFSHPRAAHHEEREVHEEKTRSGPGLPKHLTTLQGAGTSQFDFVFRVFFVVNTLCPVPAWHGGGLLRRVDPDRSRRYHKDDIFRRDQAVR